MTARCPRCNREWTGPTLFCGGCGAPLLLRDEPAPPVDAALDLDRRAAAVAAVDRSDWELGLLEPEPDARPAHAAPPAVAGAVLPGPGQDAFEIHVLRASSERRAAAWAIDAAPFAIAGGALCRSLMQEALAGLPAPPTGIDGFLDVLAREWVIVLSVLAAATISLAVYVTLSHALAGATLGKWLMRLRVIGPDGARPSPARCTARTALAMASAALLGLGFLLALFTRSGRALHDLIARTWVVKAP